MAMANYQYVPTKGDEVYALGQNGSFTVRSVHTDPNSVDLKLIGPREFILKGVPWGALTIIKKAKTREDVNQTAARIVREATED